MNHYTVTHNNTYREWKKFEGPTDDKAYSQAVGHALHLNGQGKSGVTVRHIITVKNQPYCIRDWKF